MQGQGGLKGENGFCHGGRRWVGLSLGNHYIHQQLRFFVLY
jgi:hypothetical protein